MGLGLGLGLGFGLGLGLGFEGARRLGDDEQRRLRVMAAEEQRVVGRLAQVEEEVARDRL